MAPRKKKAIVLDLDENLVHSIVSNKENQQLKNKSDFHFQLYKDQYYVFKRPGLNNFLKTVFSQFDYIGFWTTGVAPYATKILKNILNKEQALSSKLLFIYTRGNCTRLNNTYYKPLQKIWDKSKKFRPKNTIMMDNTLHVMKFNLQNALLTPHYDKRVLKTDKYLSWLNSKIKQDLHKMDVYKFVDKYSLPKNI